MRVKCDTNRQALSLRFDGRSVGVGAVIALTPPIPGTALVSRRCGRPAPNGNLTAKSRFKQVVSIEAIDSDGADGSPDSGAAGADAAGADAGSLMPEVTAGPGHVRPSTAYLVYLFKRGTFYPFIPDGHEHRDLEQELKLKSLVSDDLKVEPDLDRWFPLWDLPVG